jgi:protein TonB
MAASLTIHIGVAIALFTIVSPPLSTTPVRTRSVIYLDPIPYHHRTLKDPPGGGGGGRAKLPVSKGRLPKQSPRPFTPPMILAKGQQPILLMPPALATATDTVNLPQWGDPLSNSLLYSNGPGDGGGMGSGHDGGVGPGTGPRHWTGGTGGSGETAISRGSDPELLFKVEPEFSEEARRAKYSGTVILLVDVDTSGHAVNVRVAKGLGLGLDEKAVEAVSRWRFRPGRRNGKAVVVPASIEVNFHLL